MHDWSREITDAFVRAGHDADVDIVEELSQHAAAAYQTARADGGSDADAQTEVRRQIAIWTREAAMLRRRPRRIAPPAPPPSRSRTWIAGLVQDLRYTIRLQRRRPGPGLVSAITMALGIAASTVLFSIAWGVLVKPLPWPDADRLVRLEERRHGATRQLPGIMTNGPFLAIREAPTTLDAIAAYRAQTATMTGGAEPERIRITATTASLFPLMRMTPVRGSVFTSADETVPVTVISYGLWQRRFGAREDIIGSAIAFDGVAYTIVAVAGRDFLFPDAETDAWIPSSIRPTASADGGSWIQIFSAIARLKDGATAAQAGQEATARAQSAPDGGMAAMAVFGTRGAAEITAQPVLDALTSDVKSALIVLLAGVGLLLATATANIAGVQLARAATRRKEMAVRAAIGAGSGRLARQVITESVVTGLGGGALGFALAAALHRSLPQLLPAGFPRVQDITLDWRVALFAFAIALLASLAAGLAPALQARRLNLVESLVEDAPTSGRAFGRSGIARVRGAIMTGQVAVACVLLVGAVLLTRTFVAMLNADRGFEASNVLTAELATPGGLFTSERRAQLVTQVLDRLRARNDIAAAGISTSVPLVPGDAVIAFTLPPPPGQDVPVQVQASYRMISPGYLEAMGIRLVAGRLLDQRDTPTSSPALLVNRAFAGKYLSADSVGRRIPAALIGGKDDWEVAGIIEDVRMGSNLTETAQPEILVSYLQFPEGLRGDPIFAIRTRHDPSVMISTLRQTVRELDSTATLQSVVTMEERVAGSLAHPRLYAVVLTGFGIFALIIAGVGLFGALSYAVTQRSKEIGIRAALGARPRAVARLIVADALIVALAGCVIGLGAAAVMSRALASFLFGVDAGDPGTFALAALAILAASAAACVVPVRRAVRLDPLQALKAE